MKTKGKPPESELGEPKKKFSETFSAVTLLKEKFFPKELDKEEKS